MKKIVLSLAVISMLAATGANASTNSEIRALKADMAKMNAKITELEKQDEETTELVEKYKKATPVFAKTSKLKFSGLHYLGYAYTSYADDYVTGSDPLEPTDNGGRFETRRNYLQVKAYLFEDPKSYMRVTMDTFQENDEETGDAQGSWLFRLKYAYIWLDKIAPDYLPGTGIEFGQAHRPWIDYEEHNSFFYRSVSKVFVEDKNAADLTNSADIGINVKTKLPYFSSEFGVFNGEGYHAVELGDGLSFEWRTTAHILGTGKTQKDHPTEVTYWDASFFGQYNTNNNKYSYIDASGSEEGQTYKFYGLHTVYNMPAFMVGAQYVKSDFDYKNYFDFEASEAIEKSWYKKNGKGYSAHAVGRFGADYEYEVFGRYDHWEPENANDLATDGKLNSFETDNFIYGVAWQQNKNLKWLVNGITYKAKDGLNYKGGDANDYTNVMLTAEVHW